jgi:hypothetical protein
VSPEDVDGIRRSLAIGDTITKADAEQLLDTCRTLLERQTAIARVLDQLGPSRTDARRALNELSRLVREP